MNANKTQLQLRVVPREFFPTTSGQLLGSMFASMKATLRVAASSLLLLLISQGAFALELMITSSADPVEDGTSLTITIPDGVS